MKNKLIKLNLLLATGLMISGCNVNHDNKASAPLKQKISFNTKPVNYLKDTTTEVLLDAKINKKDITKVIKHGDHWHVFTIDGKEHITYVDPDLINDDEGLSMVSVVSLEQLKKLSVKTIKVHGNHWHIYTNDGSEYLTYEDPSALFPGIYIEEYQGNHHDHHEHLIHNKQHYHENEIVLILVHDDHYHCYTADGTEFISYTDPRKKFPKAKFGIYKGNHQSPKADKTVKKPSHKDGLVNVVSLEELGKIAIVKILKHENHYHCYTKDNVEYITYDNPSKLFPKIKIGTYIGKHGHSHQDDNIDWPKNVTRIVDHGDHWHLYQGEKEVAVVRVNPRKHYPDAEYIDESKKGNSDVEVNDNELFKYEDVEEKIVDSVLPYLTNNLKAMTDYGILETNLEVYGVSKEELANEVFYWLHGGHYHATTIKQIIQAVKNNKFGANNAKDVVATLKYKVNHKDASLEAEITVDRNEVIEYLSDYYHLPKKAVEYLGNKITIYGSKTIYLQSALFVKENGIIKYLDDLPKMPPVTKLPENDDAKVEKDEKIPQPKLENKPKKELNETTIEEVFKQYGTLYNMDEDDFIDAFFNLEGLPKLNEVKFNEDATVEYRSHKYEFKTGKLLS